MCHWVGYGFRDPHLKQGIKLMHLCLNRTFIPWTFSWVCLGFMHPWASKNCFGGRPKLSSLWLWAVQRNNPSLEQPRVPQLTDYSLNPFTPESDQCQISPPAPPKIWHHTVWRTWLFIAYSDEKWLYYKFFLKGWENTLFELRSERVKQGQGFTVSMAHPHSMTYREPLLGLYGMVGIPIWSSFA